MEGLLGKFRVTYRETVGAVETQDAGLMCLKH